MGHQEMFNRYTRVQLFGVLLVGLQVACNGSDRSGESTTAVPPSPVTALTPSTGTATASAATAATATLSSTVPTATTLQIRSPVMQNGGMLPMTYTCDGDSIPPPIEWSGAPAGTRSFALIMHHIPGPGDSHWYWVRYNLAATQLSLSSTESAVGFTGTNSVNGTQSYAPPCSQGSGVKWYIVTIYALSEPPPLSNPTVADPSQVDRATLLQAIEPMTLASAELSVRYDRIAVEARTPITPLCTEKSAAFAPYSDQVTTSCDEDYLYVTSLTGLPQQSPTDRRDQAMVGITAWINRVPLPFALNWKIPLEPRWYTQDWASAASRGPIAVAVNGVPIFHYDKRPDVDTDPRHYSYQAENDTVVQGELDQCGGHAGQGDDYHYHYAPICLLDRYDPTQPIAYALDGAPIYFGTGGTDQYGGGRYNTLNNLPKGSLDACNAYDEGDGTYRYYTTSTPPYVIGCHRASVDPTLAIQVPPLQKRAFQEPQPNGRLAGEPITTEVTALTTDTTGWTTLTYGTEQVSYRRSHSAGDCWDFRWSDATPDPTQSYTYCR